MCAENMVTIGAELRCDAGFHRPDPVAPLPMPAQVVLLREDRPERDKSVRATDRIEPGVPEISEQHVGRRALPKV
jgi:hypothetical protein